MTEFQIIHQDGLFIVQRWCWVNEGPSMQVILINVLPYFFLGVVVGIIGGHMDIAVWLTVVVAVLISIPVKLLIDAGLS